MRQISFALLFLFVALTRDLICQVTGSLQTPQTTVNRAARQRTEITTRQLRLGELKKPHVQVARLPHLGFAKGDLVRERRYPNSVEPEAAQRVNKLRALDLNRERLLGGAAHKAFPYRGLSTESDYKNLKLLKSHALDWKR